ncbi:type II toxin-antitoxin system HicA family toxin [Rubrivirga sp. S365]|uniref:Type II toxin-antitoxin system HicA family toxin n=1 Tax=Rubrivirga litoralis TaxID=3075598 RepID=A0ABU3BSX7_9BACT|nr:MULTISPECIES: type II toxin-antitoxin system HicA family toxin [unclassified Rubrivirga]MDT0632271.1 type II toxin-antitoxin system HicA family toxin [Rubrivirga sp. F394]MDT7856344.1 type II toxin-antitoxin system HicA family toxin [Rubrivirga sp. S365]
MSQFGSVKARKLLRALLKLGWSVKRETGGSHKVLEREGWPDFVFAFHDGVEVGPKMLSRVAKRTGLKPNDL